MSRENFLNLRIGVTLLGCGGCLRGRISHRLAISSNLAVSKGERELGLDWAMNKLLVVWTCTLLATFSNLALANQEALTLLLGNGQLVISMQPACEPYQPDSQQSSGAKTLSQDVALVLAEMVGKPVEIESLCEALPDARKQCRVVFSVNQGELEWARVYQFTSSPNSLKTPKLADLNCFNLP